MENGNSAYDLFGLYGQGLNGAGSNTPLAQQQYQQAQQQPGGRFATQPSTQMVRRNTNQQMMQQQQHNYVPAWPDMGDAVGGAQGLVGAGGGAGGTWENSDDDEDLEAKALKAKKDAQSKRKQIHPFVKKLSSFLDESRNTELIRWSDDGNSFIVVDEDEFAKTLIPELFKHNNYASFVRQLNMYGFHKKVGLTDNSMRASEQKKKLPSVYYNKYFKRGRPELLWLIQKPKAAGGGGKRKRDDKSKGDGDSDEDQINQGLDNQGTSNEAGSTNKNIIMHNTSEINNIRNEVQMMQRQQKYILNVIQQLKRQNDQFYQQATAYQQMHERHENSINAILNFLATFYNRTLDKNGPDLADIFSHAISGKHPQHGTVVDVGEDVPELKVNPPAQYQRRRPLALLPAPELDTVAENVSSIPSTTRSSNVLSPAPQNGTQQARPASRGNLAPPTQYSQQGTQSPTIKTEVGTPNMGQNTQNDELLSVINAANSNQGYDSPNLDFSAALSQLQSANNQAQLTPQERDSMLAMMANDASNSGMPTLTNSNNAVVSPTPPSFPPLDDIASARNQIDMLEKLQEQQARRVSELTDRLQPLSPHGGGIPGLDEDGYPFNSNQAVGNPGDWDLNSFVQSDDYFPQISGDGQADMNNTGMANGDIDFGDVDFGFTYGDGDASKTVNNSNGNDSGANHTTGFLGDDFGNQGRVESISSSAASPSTVGGEEVEGERSASKKRKVR